jgi:hypothetical protein
MCEPNNFSFQTATYNSKIGGQYSDGAIMSYWLRSKDEWTNKPSVCERVCE